MEELRRSVGSSPSVFPHFKTAGPCLSTPGGHGSRGGFVVGAMQTAQGQVEKLVEADVDYFKIIHQMNWDKINHSQDDLNTMVSVAHEAGKKVFMHVAHNVDIEMGLIAGVDVFAHSSMQRIPDELLKKMVGIEASYLENQYFLDHMPPAYESVIHPKEILAGELSEGYAALDTAYENILYNTARFIELGGVVLAGTDAGNTHVYFGYSLHNELSEYVKSGCTEVEALRTATWNVHILFPDLNTGRIEKDFFADLVILNGDPTTDIQNSLSINTVLRNGKIVIRN